MIAFIKTEYNKDKSGKRITGHAGREKLLLDTIKGLKNRDKLEFPLSAIYLFYDGFDGVIKHIPIEYMNNVERKSESIS